MADVIAATCIACTVAQMHLTDNIIEILCLAFASCFLYAGGVVMNDVADISIDKIERPERPIPAKLVSKTGATIWALLLSATAIVLASWVSIVSAILAILIVIASYVYDFYGKHYAIGPINMGLCRALNFSMGLSISLQVLQSYWWLSLIAVVYIAAITMISKGEVSGGNQSAIRNAAIMFGFVIGVLAFIAITQQTHFYAALFFVALFTFYLYKPLIMAYQQPQPALIRKAVKAGVIGIILLDACLLAAFMGLLPALFLCALLPISLIIAKIFAVT